MEAPTQQKTSSAGSAAGAPSSTQGIMRAAVITHFGGPEVIELRDNQPKPVPGPRELLIKVKAASINPADCLMRSGTLIPLRSMVSLPAVLGIDFSGVVEQAGGLTHKHMLGERVFGRCKKGGAYAEYAIVSEDSISTIPENISFEQAAAAPVVALTAYAALVGKGEVQRGHKVLILGASGGVGSYAVKLAKHIGATVAGTTSESNIDFVKSLGADIVINYKTTDVKQALAGQLFDVVLDTVGGDESFNQCLPILNRKGKFISTIGPMSVTHHEKVGWFGAAKLGATTAYRVLSKKVLAGPTYDVILPMDLKDQYLHIIATLMTLGVTPAVEAKVPFNQIHEAHRIVDSGHAKGKVVLLIDSQLQQQSSQYQQQQQQAYGMSGQAQQTGFQQGQQSFQQGQQFAQPQQYQQGFQPNQTGATGY
jgi:NADPH:quinone reductase-like Zn-dependent oxidoreductase